MLEPLDVQPTGFDISAEFARVQKMGLPEYLFGFHSMTDSKAVVDPTISERVHANFVWPICRALVDSETPTPIPIHLLSFSELISYHSGGSLIEYSISDLRERCRIRLQNDPHALSALSRRLLARFRAFGEQNDLFEAIWCYDRLESTLIGGSDVILYLEAALGLIDSILCRYIRLHWDSDAERILQLILYFRPISSDLFQTVGRYVISHVSRGVEGLI